jgi:hypothetical protein
VQEGDIVMNNDDFYFEIGKNEFFKRTETRERELVDLRIEDDKYVFDYGDTVHTLFCCFSSRWQPADHYPRAEPSGQKRAEHRRPRQNRDTG